MDYKTCGECKQALPPHAFRTYANGKLRAVCVVCQRKLNKGYSDKHRQLYPDRFKASNAAYAARHPEVAARKNAKWRKNNPEVAKSRGRKANLVYYYKLTVEQFDAMVVSQNGQCAICGIAPEGRPLNVDHCHTTGNVRGLLCLRCNMMLGYAKDQPSVLQAAARYLGGQKILMAA